VLDHRMRGNRDEDPSRERLALLAAGVVRKADAERIRGGAGGRGCGKDGGNRERKQQHGKSHAVGSWSGAGRCTPASYVNRRGRTIARTPASVHSGAGVPTRPPRCVRTGSRVARG